MKNLKTSTPFKVAAYIILTLAGIICLLSTLGIIVAVELNYYLTPVSEIEFNHPIPFYENLRIFIFNLRYEAILVAVVSLIIAICCFVFLINAAGHHKGKEGITENWLTKIPLDLLAVGEFFLVAFAILCADFFWGTGMVFFLICVSFPVSLVTLTIFFTDFAVRVKSGKWWKNTLVYRILHFAGKMMHKLYKFNQEIFLSLPSIRKTGLVVVFICIIELFVFLLTMYNPEVYVLFWVIEKAVLIPAILYCALIFQKLQKSGRELAAGNLSHHTDTKELFWDFKEHGENLNSIAQGMALAVEERLKSERLKTELITNVSHDIKTPLTSIINYSDLISKEPCDNKKITEYSTALFRQSERLKKLINDLMDASKVSTGNVDVLLAPCETDVILTQAAGEYEDRLKQQELELVVKKPDTPFCIMADGRHIWRIFDNLMNNVCKYAQNGTRVYLTLEKQNEKAVFSLKNTSHYALDISSDELMERFVRGDRSRHTEGSGLGLSIAQSLTELQNGEFSLSIDGDLFKAVMKFDIV